MVFLVRFHNGDFLGRRMSTVRRSKQERTIKRRLQNSMTKPKPNPSLGRRDLSGGEGSKLEIRWAPEMLTERRALHTKKVRSAEIHAHRSWKDTCGTRVEAQHCDHHRKCVEAPRIVRACRPCCTPVMDLASPTPVRAQAVGAMIIESMHHSFGAVVTASWITSHSKFCKARRASKTSHARTNLS